MMSPGPAACIIYGRFPAFYNGHMGGGINTFGFFFFFIRIRAFFQRHSPVPELRDYPSKALVGNGPKNNSRDRTRRRSRRNNVI